LPHTGTIFIGEATPRANSKHSARAFNLENFDLLIFARRQRMHHFSIQRDVATDTKSQFPKFVAKDSIVAISRNQRRAHQLAAMGKVCCCRA